MTFTDIANIRLSSQQISGTKFKTPKEIVSWMGAIQAQDYAMSKWGVGVRLPGSSQFEIEKAIDSCKIIRTHVLRPTWHLVSSDDIHWMLELTAPHIKVLMRSQEKQLELSESIYTKSNVIIEKALAKSKTLTRKELMNELKKAKIDTTDIRAAHFMFRAELEGIVCNGIPKGKMLTYSLLSERVKKKTNTLTREEAATKLAKIYFRSHYPVTLKDFIWWSGLPAKDAKTSLENIKSDLISETVGSEMYWLSSSFSKIQIEPSLYLLPAYDEFIISYKNRNAAISKENQGKAFTNNGLFKPVILKNGKVIGLWKRAIVKGKVIIETDFFKQQSKSTRKLIEKTAESYGQFLNKELEVRHGI